MDAGGGIRGSSRVLKIAVFPILPILVRIPGDLSELMPNPTRKYPNYFCESQAQPNVHKKYNRFL